MKLLHHKVSVNLGKVALALARRLHEFLLIESHEPNITAEFTTFTFAPGLGLVWSGCSHGTEPETWFAEKGGSSFYTMLRPYSGKPTWLGDSILPEGWCTGTCLTFYEQCYAIEG